MSSRLLILCPGQGSQHGAMFDLARTDARAARLIDECAPPFGDADMFENRLAQPLIVAATLAMWVALRDHVPAPALTAGYSIGELAAHGVAGAITPQEAVELATQRARLMDEAALAHPGQSMLAVSGVAVERIRDMAAEAGAALAIVTGEDSCIVGGERACVELLAGVAEAAGGRCQLLPVAVASHTPLLDAAVPRFAAVLESSSWTRPACPVLSGMDASRIMDKSHAVAQLSRQIAHTIQWSACMDAAVEAGITVALELGPGASLSRMFRTRYPDLPCRSVSEFRSIDGIVTWLERQAG